MTAAARVFFLGVIHGVLFVVGIVALGAWLWGYV